MTGSLQVVRVDVWELRCRFNRWERRHAHEALSVLDRRNQSRHGPPNTFHEQWYYRDPTTGDDIARYSQFVHADGSLAASKKRDPKVLCVEGVEYHLIAGGPQKHDPGLRFPEGSLRRHLYAVWRKVKCFVVGR